MTPPDNRERGLDPASSELQPVADALLRDRTKHKLQTYAYNSVTVTNSQASAVEYWGIMKGLSPIQFNVALISFPLPEYLCFAGETEELYELVVSGVGFHYETTCRLDNDFMEVVYHQDGSFTQVFGSPAKVVELKAQQFSAVDKYTASVLKSFFTIALAVPNVEDDLTRTALRRSALRFAVAGLNKFADCHRRYVGIPWASVPHYSFFSFPYGYIREFDFDGKLLTSKKYMMNPATGILPERPHCVAPNGTYLERFENALREEEDSDSELNMFRKGEAYGGHGHDLASIRLCVSAVDAILRRWAREKKVQLRDATPEKARLKQLLGKFEETLTRKKLVERPDKYMSEVRDAINFRHAIEHENLYTVDSTMVFPKTNKLKAFFEMVHQELLES
ncbi:MAG: hypothetical protein H6822_29810 [Planctomycetaceae bacterium]|nr:hypothetical protein [Planctomycetales bacterium]MCB9926380.1 hypothetical protein [Planctomycetaceae bacterium]